MAKVRFVCLTLIAARGCLVRDFRLGVNANDDTEQHVAKIMSGPVALDSWRVPALRVRGIVNTSTAMVHLRYKVAPHKTN